MRKHTEMFNKIYNSNYYEWLLDEIGNLKKCIKLKIIKKIL